jgi:hypothetical protein
MNILVLQLDKKCFYVAPQNLFSNYASVGIPYLATIFSGPNELILSEVRKAFKNAKFVQVNITWTIE